MAHAVFFVGYALHTTSIFSPGRRPGSFRLKIAFSPRLPRRVCAASQRGRVAAGSPDNMKHSTRMRSLFTGDIIGLPGHLECNIAYPRRLQDVVDLH